ncbi:MAG: divalent-cation tolerance protein CutA, partial [Gammaproteobacteria bacterium]|nr:divalent-cation tolerance protein CutA [Gammaproteobacteria bacterium]NNJ73373.1 divalent-cation tolerance protein CutA [Enterobacterales bacterium]
TMTTVPEANPEPLEVAVVEQLELMPTAPLHLTLCNVKSRDEAREIARGLVENKLAACVNFIANIGAIYRWQDNIEDISECQLQIKSVPSRDEDIKNYIIAHHSYDVPEIITMPIHQVNDDYVQWVIQETTP